MPSDHITPAEWNTLFGDDDTAAIAEATEAHAEQVAASVAAKADRHATLLANLNPYGDYPALDTLVAALTPQYAALHDQWLHTLNGMIKPFCARFGVHLSIGSYYDEFDGTRLWESYWSRAVPVGDAPQDALERFQADRLARLRETKETHDQCVARLEGYQLRVEAIQAAGEAGSRYAKQTARSIEKMERRLASVRRRAGALLAELNATTFDVTIHEGDSDGKEDLSPEDRAAFDGAFGTLVYLLACPSPFGVSNYELLNEDYGEDD